MPQASTSKWVVPRPVIPSTTSRAGELAALRSFGDGPNVVAGGGRGFGGLDVDGFGVGMQSGLDLFEIEGFAVGGGDQVDLAAEGLGQGDPALAEFAGGEDQDAVAGRGEVGDRGFHGAGAGAGEEQDVILGADELLQLGEDLGVEGAELGGAVVDVRSGHGELGGGEQRGGSGGEEAGFAEHGGISSKIWPGVDITGCNHRIHTNVNNVNRANEEK